MTEVKPKLKGKKKWLIVAAATAAAVVDTLAAGGVLPDILAHVAALLRGLALA